MSRMLNLVDAGWAAIGSLVARGQRAEALTRITHLLTHPDLPASIVLEAHRLAGELLLDVEKHSRARRHLRAAAALAPTHARTYYLWGLSHELDPRGCDRQAYVRFRAACEHEPENPVYRATYGRAAVRCERLKRGVRELLAAADAAPGELTVVRIVIEGLLEAKQFSSARKVLNRARFLCFDRTKEREVETLWERVRFESTRFEQRGTTRHRQDADFARDGGRVVLPFVRISSDAPTDVSGESVRLDVLSMPRPHFPRLRARRADR